jgi:hypothetical protein
LVGDNDVMMFWMDLSQAQKVTDVIRKNAAVAGRGP